MWRCSQAACGVGVPAGQAPTTVATLGLPSSRGSSNTRHYTASQVASWHYRRPGVHHRHHTRAPASLRAPPLSSPTCRLWHPEITSRLQNVSPLPHSYTSVSSPARASPPALQPHRPCRQACPHDSHFIRFVPEEFNKTAESLQLIMRDKFFPCR